MLLDHLPSSSVSIEETFPAQERLPRRRTRIRKSLELARGAASRVWRGGLRWSKHTLSFRWVCSWTSVPAMSPKPRDEDGVTKGIEHTTVARSRLPADSRLLPVIALGCAASSTYGSHSSLPAKTTPLYGFTPHLPRSTPHCEMPFCTEAITCAPSG